MANNNEKILNLVKNKSRIEELSTIYLKQLKVRKEQKSQAKSNFFSVRRKINLVNKDIDREIKSIEKYLLKREVLFEEIKAQAEHISNILEDNSKDKSKVLEEILEASYDEFVPKNTLAWSNYLRREISTRYKRIFSLLELVDVAKYEREDILNLSKVSKQLDETLDEFMRSEKSYLSQGGGEKLSNRLSNINFYSMSNEDELQKHRDEINKINSEISFEKIIFYPDTTKLEEVIHGIRDPNLYIKRGYTILEFVSKVYSSMNYLQRALREKREYVGARNAFEKYFSAINDLQSYYNSKYVQAGGKPSNYHGHRAGEHK